MSATKLCNVVLFNSQHIDVVAEYKKKLENERPMLNLVVIGELYNLCGNNTLYIPMHGQIKCHAVIYDGGIFTMWYN